jgi:hypothetical protein
MRANYRWFARELGVGVWSLVRVSRAYPRLADELEAAPESKPPRIQVAGPQPDAAATPMDRTSAGRRSEAPLDAQ